MTTAIEHLYHTVIDSLTHHDGAREQLDHAATVYAANLEEAAARAVDRYLHERGQAPPTGGTFRVYSWRRNRIVPQHADEECRFDFYVETDETTLH